MKNLLLKSVAVAALMTSQTMTATFAGPLPVVLAQATATEPVEPKLEKTGSDTKADRKAARKAEKKAEKAAAKETEANNAEANANAGQDKKKAEAEVKANPPQEDKAEAKNAEADTNAKKDTEKAETEVKAEPPAQDNKEAAAQNNAVDGKAAEDKTAKDEAAEAKSSKKAAAGESDAKKAETDSSARQAKKKTESEAELTAKPPSEDEKKAARAATVGDVDPSKNAAAVVKDDLSAKQKASLEAVEKERRRAKRRDREKLLGTFALGAAVGVIVNELGGKVVEDQGDRIVVERDGIYVIRKDENDLFRRNDSRVEDELLANGRMRTTVYRPNGSKIVTIREADGTINQRFRVRPDGDRVMLIDNRIEGPRRHRDFRRELGELRFDIPREDYIVETRRADRRALRRAFNAEPVERIERNYTLTEVRYSSRLRDKMRRVDLDTITFATNVFSLSQSQVDLLADVAGAIDDVIQDNPREIFLIEGHTDAVGDEISNLTLSDRRADTVAQILTSVFGLPPENFVVQGYGETNLKINTQSDERANRRVTIRRITPLMGQASR